MLWATIGTPFVICSSAIYAVAGVAGYNIGRECQKRQIGTLTTANTWINEKRIYNYIYKKTMAEVIKNPSSVLSAGHYDYNEAILLYDKEIETVPSNYIAYNNRGLCKIHLGADPYNVRLIEDGMNDFNISIELAKKEGVVFESPVHNLALAINMLNF